MKVVSTDSVRKNITRKVIILTLFLAIQFSLINSNSGNLIEVNSNLGGKVIFSMAQDPVNDTTGPIIVFIQPAENFTIIRQYSYNFIVNITDDNPPLFGNVTIQISNQSSFLFNSSMNFDGGNQRKLTEKIVTCSKPVPSNDGSKIAFISYENGYSRLFTIDTSGNNLVLIAQNDEYCGCPSWSPDDSRLLFTQRTDFTVNKNDIFVIDVASNNETRLTFEGTY